MVPFLFCVILRGPRDRELNDLPSGSLYVSPHTDAVLVLNIVGEFGINSQYISKYPMEMDMDGKCKDSG